MHRTANVNEYSGRYSLMPMLFYSPEKENLQYQSKTNKQGRKEQMPESFADYYDVNSNAIRSQVQVHYQNCVQEDLARELARIDLPLSTYTQWYWKIDLHNLMHFLKLRVDSHAQWEIQQYGKVMAGMFKAVAPLSYEAWLDYDVCGEKFSHQELEIIRSLLKTEDNGVFTSGDRFSPLPESISKRERDELLSKLQPKEKPDFELDLSQAKSPDFFKKKMADAVPSALKS